MRTLFNALYRSSIDSEKTSETSPMKRIMVLATIAGMMLASTAAHAGRVPGPLQPPHRDSVNAGETDVYTMTFRGGEEAVIRVRGDLDTILVLEVRDENGNLIARDNDLIPPCVVSFTPKWTGPFTVRVINTGTVYNNYTIETN
jgi:hypothetical protein